MSKALSTHPDLDQLDSAQRTELGEMGAHVLNNSGEELRSEAKRTLNAELLTLAIDLLTSAVQVAPTEEDRSGFVLNLGHAYHDRFLMQGRQEDLETAVEQYQRAVEGVPENSQIRGLLMNGLGVGLRELAHSRGTAELYDHAVEAFRKAIEGPGADQAAARSNLGTMLEDRYVLTGRVGDLRAAVRHHEEAVAKTPEEAKDLLALRLNNFGNSLRLLSYRLAESKMRARGVEALEKSEALTDEDDFYLFTRLSNLGNLVLDQALLETTTRDDEEIEALLKRAIDLYERALASAMPDASDRSSVLNNLGNGYLYLTRRQDDRQTRCQAIHAFRKSLKATTEESPARWARQNNLAVALLEGEPTSEEVDEAFELFESVLTGAAEEQPQASLSSAISWARWALEAGDPETAARIGQKGLEISQRLFRRQHHRWDRMGWMYEDQILPWITAQALARMGEGCRAVEVLEHAQGRLLADAWRLDSAMVGAVLDGREQAEIGRYRAAVSRLESALNRDPGTIDLDEELPSAAELEAIQDEADVAFQRWQTECADAAAGEEMLSYEEIRAVVPKDACLLYLLAGEPEGLLVAVFRDAERPEVRLVPGLSLEAMDRRLSSAAWTGRKSPNEKVEKLARWLGEWLFKDVVDLVGDIAMLDLVACGALAVFPVHIARLDGRSLTDRYGIRHQLSARAARASARRTENALSEVLAVTWEPSTPVSDMMAPGDRLGGEEATKESVLAALPGHRHLYLECHGKIDTENPYETHFVLPSEERLTVGDMIEVRGTRELSLAVLSSCDVALPGPYLPSEGIGLPMAFARLGARGVIAPWWKIDQHWTLLLLTYFYWCLAGGDSAVDALGRAKRWLRDESEVLKRSWLKDRSVEFERKGRKDLADLLNQLDLEISRHGHEVRRQESFFWNAFGYFGS